MDADQSTQLQEQVRDACAEGRALRIQGGGSKAFYGREIRGEPLDMSGHRGLVHYQSSELVVSARAGTPLAEIEALLAQRNQFLPFEPPHFGVNATLGGAIATGLSGPRRPYAGSARDFVLGVKILNGKGEVLKFGGEVMKNVAGFDVSRLMAGSLGTLGVLLEVSLKVLPRPTLEETRVFHCAPLDAIQRMSRWAGQPLPITGAAYHGERLHVRLSGSATGVQAAAQTLGGEILDGMDAFWQDLREQRLSFFDGDAPLWRLSLPPACPPLDLTGDWLIDWGGAQRWLRSNLPADRIRSATQAAGGHATLFRGGDRLGEVFQPLSPALLRLHQQLKAAFDPQGIFNPGRLYAEF
ncbi:glycolate oxidase subunit GlcE [Thermithiobacillus plumbiphilus]|uniref:Glycolate oxidase subunit GlcE n=1 Tax=Thermithiobacillus plumbiphilus TaxID=1729899 RepID=A0ABU9D7Q0_9PROT